jgi:hypothetical protein
VDLPASGPFVPAGVRRRIPRWPRLDGQPLDMRGPGPASGVPGAHHRLWRALAARHAHSVLLLLPQLENSSLARKGCPAITEDTAGRRRVSDRDSGSGRSAPSLRAPSRLINSERLRRRGSVRPASSTEVLSMEERALSTTSRPYLAEERTRRKLIKPNDCRSIGVSWRDNLRFTELGRDDSLRS